MSNQDTYGSGLNSQDWISLRDVLWPFLHAEDPSEVEISRNLPSRLEDHPLVALVREYKATGAVHLLDQAGRLLIPTNEPFGWYVPLTK